jgi:hypothetical protein
MNPLTWAYSFTSTSIVRGQPDSGLYDAIDDPILKRKVNISKFYDFHYFKCGNTLTLARAVHSQPDSGRYDIADDPVRK